MKYFIIDYDWENYVNGKGTDYQVGILSENNQTRDMFQEHFQMRLVIDQPKVNSI